MKIIIGVFLLITFLATSGIHFYWAFGGKWGVSASLPTNAVGEKVLNPKMFECLFVAFTLLLFGVFVLIKSDLLTFKIPVWVNNYGLWLLAAIFIVRSIGDFKYVGFFKKIKMTTFGRNDTRYYSPLCFTIGFLCVVLQFIN
jgi:glucan phosphoethanolaminetransferase (alkaline phosphatase superfamily)